MPWFHPRDLSEKEAERLFKAVILFVEEMNYKNYGLFDDLFINFTYKNVKYRKTS